MDYTGSFQLSSPLSSSWFLREPGTLKTFPVFQHRSGERMGQSQSASRLFSAHCSARDHLVWLAQPGGEDGAGRQGRWWGWWRHGPRSAALINWTTLFLACPHKSAALGNFPHGLFLKPVLPLGRATVNLGFFTVPLSPLGICSRCDLKHFRLFFLLSFFFPLWLFQSSARAVPDVSTVHVQTRRTAHARQLWGFLRALDPLRLHSASDTPTHAERDPFVSTGHPRNSFGAFCIR